MVPLDTAPQRMHPNNENDDKISKLKNKIGINKIKTSNR